MTVPPTPVVPRRSVIPESPIIPTLPVLASLNSSALLETSQHVYFVGRVFDARLKRWALYFYSTEMRGKAVLPSIALPSE